MADTLIYSSYNLFGSDHSPSTDSAGSSMTVSQYLFSVPPPASVGSLCPSCSSCGAKTSEVSEDDRTFALQLRAAAVFNKTVDVPPPIIAAPTLTTDAAVSESLSPLSCSSSSSPPHSLTSLPSTLPFTCFPPPPISYHTGQDYSSLHDPQGEVASMVSTAPTSTYSTLYEPTFSGMKRMSDMGEESPVKRARHGDEVDVRLLIQSKAAGSVIGKGGKNISRLRSENSCSITVPDCPGPERILTVTGSEDVVLKVLEEILEALDDTQQRDNGDSDVRMLVHHSQAGCIIGKGGSRIKELREICKGHVKVYSNCCPQSSDRVIQIIGERDLVLQTIESVLKNLAESPIKGPMNNYNPHNFDEFYAQDYGGWAEMPKGRFPPMGPGGPMGRGPMGPGPFGGPPSGPPHFNRRGGPPYSRGGGGGGGGMHSPNGGGGGGDYDGGMRGGKSFMNGGNSHDEDQTSTQVTIPKDAAGAIIGKGGARIRKIRFDSGAGITIEDSRPGSNDRIISISGTDSQIKHAQYLLQQSVREFGGPFASGGGDRGRRY